MKKTPMSWIFVAIILTIPSIIWFVRFFSWEDNRICTNWERIKHWNPSQEKPTDLCTWNTNKQKPENKNSVLTNNPNQMVNHSFSISMERPNNWMIGKDYTCQWEWKFPEIKLTNIPSKTKTLSLIVDDPDAPNWTRTHLLLANIEFSWSEKTINTATIKSSTIGKNSRWNTNRWAPCPPSWTHRYFFRVFALDTKLNINNWFSKQDLTKTMENHILEKKELIWLYKKQ